MPEILERCGIKYLCNTSGNLFKNHAKCLIFEVQICDSQDEWEGTNTPLYNVPGLPRASQENLPKISYVEHNFAEVF